MPRSNWVPIIALVGLIGLTGAGNQPAERGVSTNANQQAQPIPAAIPPVVAPEKYAPYPNRKSDRCYESDDHEAADLCAQWRAAYAAEKAVIVGLVGAFLSFASLIAVALSLWQTRKALGLSETSTHAATKAADATIEANQIAAQVATNQLRAWVAFSDWAFEGHGNDGVIESYVFYTKWKNVGASPAMDTIAVSNRAGDAPFANGEPDFSVAGFVSTTPPQHSFSTTRISFTPEQILELRDTPVRIRSVVRYKTIFEDLKERYSDVTLEITFIGRHEIGEIRRGKIGPRNFFVAPVGMNNRMT